MCSHSLPLIFTLRWWPLPFLILSPLLQNFPVVLPTKKKSPLFLNSRSKSLSPFFSLSFAGLLPTFSFSLSFSCSIFQICGYDNTDTETISAFRFRLYWLFCSALQDAGGYAISRQNNLELHLGYHTCWLSSHRAGCFVCKKINVIVKNKLTTIFHGLHSYRS